MKILETIKLYVYIICGKDSYSGQSFYWKPRNSVMSIVSDRDIVISEFKIHSCYDVHSLTNALLN